MPRVSWEAVNVADDQQGEPAPKPSRTLWLLVRIWRDGRIAIFEPRKH
jgi:hypothetical protein